MPKTITNYKLYYLLFKALRVTGVFLGNFGVVSCIQYERALDNIIPPITYVAQLHYHTTVPTTHTDRLVHLDMASFYFIQFTMSLIYLKVYINIPLTTFWNFLYQIGKFLSNSMVI
jgi:hypothetical protein